MNKSTLIALPLIALLAAGATALAQVTDTASATEAEATTTVSTEAVESFDTSTGTTTVPVEPEEIVADTPTSETMPTSIGEATTTPTPPQAATASPASSIPAPTASGVVIAQEIAGLEAGYFKKSGKYLQILPNNQLPEYETGAVTEKFGTAIRADARVDVYESPQGAGYQVIFQDGNTIYSFGYGPEWVERTYSYAIPTAEASSTPTVAQ